MYLFVNKGLGMSTGKTAAQVAHAAVLAANCANTDPDLVSEWYKGGHYTKLVMEARDEEHLRNIRDYLGDRGFETYSIIDEGRTEISPHTFTALGVEIVDRDDEHTAATFSSFKTYRDPKPEPQKQRSWWAARGH